MLDFASFPHAENVTRFSAEDPVQQALRARLDEMTEADLDALERGLDLFERQGFISRNVARVLDEAPMAAAA